MRMGTHDAAESKRKFGDIHDTTCYRAMRMRRYVEGLESHV